MIALFSPKRVLKLPCFFSKNIHFKVMMTFETNFLTNYGLHHFVAFSKSSGTNVFSIKKTESLKMINHARHIITENFGEASTIVVA